MEIKQYLYKSPSTSSVQLGGLDPSSQKSDSGNFANESKTLKEVTQDPVVQTSQTIEPTITSTKIDIYA